MHARHTQGRADVRAVTSKALVNSRRSKIVNAASTNMMKKFLTRINKSSSDERQPRTIAFNQEIKMAGEIAAIMLRVCEQY